MSESALVQGTLIAGRYRLEHHLGEGGMGTVWSAVHTVTRRAVAMKFLKDSVRERADLRDRFLREAATASALKHPHVVEIIDVFDFAEGSPVMVMELLQGETLGDKLQREERLSLEETAALIVPVVSAVGAAHAVGIVHRDLKPENLFLAHTSPAESAASVKVLDFGIAKLTAERYLVGGPSGLLTESGSLLGTPCYMAPEQASGEHPVDHRADIWSLGVILYECLSGARPIEGESLPQVVARLMSAGIMPLERIAPGLPAEVTGLVKQMLTRELGRRTPNLLEVSRVLSRYTSVTAPPFAMPITRSGSSPAMTPKTLESARARERVVAGRDADPRGPTMLSSPPVNSSVLQSTPPAARRSGFAYLVGAVAIVLGLGGWIWGATKPSAGSATAIGDLPTLSTPTIPAPPKVTASEPTAQTATAAPGPTRPTSDAQAAIHLNKPRPPATPVAPKPAAAPAPPSPKPDDKLFSGRK